MLEKNNNNNLGIKSKTRAKRLDKKYLREITVAGVRDQLLTTNIIEEFISVIGSGKEATVLLAREKMTHELVCVKVFRFFTGTIRRKLQGTHHLMEDDMASLAAKQEYWNLTEMYNAKIPVPKPSQLIQNIVIMDFVHSKNEKLTQAPLLSEIDISIDFEPEEIFHEAIGILADIFLDAHFVHGDYSDHNLMVTEKGLITMDVVQSIQYNRKTYVNTPIRIRIDKAVDILKTDLNNLNKCFEKKYRISINTENVVKEILKEMPVKLRNFLKKSEGFLSGSQFVPELQITKEEFRKDSMYKRTSRKYQKKKR